MAAPRKPKVSGLNAFWSLLAAIERTTQLEASAIQEKNYEAMEVLHEAKRADFSRLVVLGKRLGLTRENPELNARLQLLARAEAVNAHAAGQLAAQLRKEWEEQGAGEMRLHSLKRAYVPGVADTDFYAEG